MRTFIKWLFGAFLMGLIMGAVDYYTGGDFWFGFVVGSLAVIGLFLFCFIFLFVIMPVFVPELYKNSKQ